MYDLNSEKKRSANDVRPDVGWTERDGIQINELTEKDMISVTTENSSYEMLVIDPETARVMVRGGRCFPSHTLAEVSGSSLGSSIKLYGIYVGYAVELFADGMRTRTSPVRNIRLFRESELAA